MIPTQLPASFHKSRRNVHIKRILDFLLGVICAWDFSASLELIWSCVDDFESVASAMLARPRRFCDAVSILVLHWQSCGLLLSNRQLFQQPLALSARSCGFLLHGALVTFVRPHTLQFGPTENWVTRLCLPPDLFEVGFAGGCAEGGIAGRGTTGDKIIAKNNYSQDFFPLQRIAEIFISRIPAVKLDVLHDWRGRQDHRRCSLILSFILSFISSLTFSFIFSLILSFPLSLCGRCVVSVDVVFVDVCECGVVVVSLCGVVWCGAVYVWSVWCVVFGCVWCLCCWCFLGLWRRKGGEGEVTLRSQYFRS